MSDPEKNGSDPKQVIRERIWNLLEEQNLVDSPRPCTGRIPNFQGSAAAAEKIRELPEYRAADCVFCAPDAVLRRVREIVLEDGKVLAVAMPHISDFVEIREKRRIREAAVIGGFQRFGLPLATRVGLFCQGSVAVDRWGNRLGKGRGYGDREWEVLKLRGLLDERIRVVTLLRAEQILEDFSALMTERDKRVDYILTPEEIIRIKI